MKKPLHGLSLIELLLGLTIFTTGFLMIIGLFPTGYRAVQQGKNLSMATHIGEQELEYTKGMAFDTIDNRSGSYDITTRSNNQTSVITFDYQLTVTTEDTDLKHVDVLVTWEEKGGMKNLRLETVVLNPAKV